MNRCRRTGTLRRRRVRCRRGLAGPLLLALSLHGSPALAAAYLPGQLPQADPPTGDTRLPPAPADQPLAAGNGIRWEFAPWRWRAALALDGRWLSIGDGRRLQQSLLSSEAEFASHVWQPWFIQVRAGLGLTLGQGRTAGGDGGRSRDNSADLSGRLQLSVFPASRFPFELRAEVSESRAGTESIVNDFRNWRFSLSQNYQPAQSNDHYSLALDHSRVRSSTGAADALTLLRLSSSHNWPDQSLESTFAYSQNARSEGDDDNRNLFVSARHSWSATPALTTETLASWNDTRLRNGAGADSGNGLLQISAVASWRPRPGDLGYSEQAPLAASATVRVSEAVQRGRVELPRARAVSLAAGVAKDLSREWRLNGGLNVSRLEVGGGRTVDVSSGNLAASWTPEGSRLGDWRYSPSAALSLVASDLPDGQRRTAAVQGSHSANRSWPLGDSQSLNFSISQALAALRESPSNELSTGISHTLGLYWQDSADNGSQSFVSLSVSDGRNRSGRDSRGQYQFANLQLSRRAQLTRFSGWAAGLTLQTTRSDSEQLDPFSGERFRLDNGWQHYYSGSLSYEDRRAFGVPRLSMTWLLTVNSQQLDRRRDGDIDAPVERATGTLESRFEYRVGLLDLRLTARAARIDERNVASIAARLQRRF